MIVIKTKLKTMILNSIQKNLMWEFYSKKNQLKFYSKKKLILNVIKKHRKFKTLF